MGNLITGKVRFSYVWVNEPRPTPSGEMRYSVTLLIPKKDTDTYQRIINEMDKALQEHVSDIFNGVMPTNPKLPLYDGDGLRSSGEPFGPECKGHWVITANTDKIPEIVDTSIPEPLPLPDRNDFYSGCYGRAALWFGAYSQSGSKGVCCKLNGLQKLEDGPRLDGRMTAAEAFGGVPYQNQASQNPVIGQTNQMPGQYPQNMGQAPQYPGQIDPVSGQPVMQPGVNNIYGIN